MQVAGAAAAILAFFLPGYAWVLISGLSRRLNRIEQATLAFVISLTFMSLLTAGLSLVTHQYLLFSLVVSIAGSILVLGVGIVKNRPKPIHFSGVKSLPKPFLLCLLIYAVFLATGFWSAPYYPTAQAPDLITHTHLTQTILAGGGRDVLLHGNIPVGLHFAAALVAYVLQVNSLEALRIVITPVLLVIVCLFFYAARRMFDSNSTAGIVMVVAAFVLPVDLIHFLRIGTYPNLLEELRGPLPALALGLIRASTLQAAWFFHGSPSHSRRLYSLQFLPVLGRDLSFNSLRLSHRSKNRFPQLSYRAVIPHCGALSVRGCSLALLPWKPRENN